MRQPVQTKRRLSVAVVCLMFSAERGGGMEQALYALVKGLRHFCDVTVVASECEGGGRLGVKSIRLPAIPCYHFLLRHLSFCLAWWGYRVVRRPRKRFDIIYTASPLYGGADFAAVHFCSAEYLRCMLATGCRRFSWLSRLKHWYHCGRHGLVSLQERVAFRDISRGHSRTTLLPVSHGLATTLRTHFGIPEDKIRVLPNPLDLSRFRPGDDPELRDSICRAMGWQQPVFIMLFVGGNWRRKGLGKAVESLLFLPSDVKLVVVGPGNPVPYQTGNLAAASKRVHFAGVRHDVERFYRAGQVLVLPSEFEALPLVCLESMGVGLPMVLTPFPGAEMLLVDGENGFLAHEARDIATAVNRLKSEPLLRNRMAESARHRSREFSVERIVGQLQTMFETCVADSGGCATR